MESSALPETYKAIVAVKLGEPPKITTLPLPKPGNNQILVKVAFAPMNPSDIDSQNGSYHLPSGTLVGFEGSGTVAALGENLKVPFTVGQKVHLRGPGTWGEYIVVNTNAAYPVQGDLSLEQAAAHIVNPGTSLYMARMAIDGGHKAAIHTLGSSALGRMLIRYCKSKGFPLINPFQVTSSYMGCTLVKDYFACQPDSEAKVSAKDFTGRVNIVRRDDYIQELKDEGADYVLNSSAPDFEAKLKELAEKEQATCAFDGIAGDFTNKVVVAQPAGSICYVYGGMGGHSVQNISIMELFKGKRISGHTFVSYFEGLVKAGNEGEFLKEIQSNLGTIFKTSVQKVFKMDDIVEALAFYEKNSSKGKILLQF